MPTRPLPFTFIGLGTAADLEPRLDAINPFQKTIGPWRRHQGDEGVTDDSVHPNHPANYRSSPSLADAVNTSIALSKPLLLTGNPGTGKSQLAERIAWEFNLGPVLRFEAQSLSEANDLFYRFDLIGYLANVQMAKSAADRVNVGALTDSLPKDPLVAERFVKLGPLGEAIVRSNPMGSTGCAALFNAVFGPKEAAQTAGMRPSVVLIDEIDKASRDFPNDLLNGIERLEFRIRELGLEGMRVNDDNRPIVIITSNSERDLPAPFLRRCTFFHIEDPTKKDLRQIVAQRFFSLPGQGADEPQLPPFHEQLVDAFWNFRKLHEDDLHYRPGTSELIDWTSAVRHQVTASDDFATHIEVVKKTSSAVSKHKEDQALLRDYLNGLVTTPAANAATP